MKNYWLFFSVMFIITVMLSACGQAAIPTSTQTSAPTASSTPTVLPSPTLTQTPRPSSTATTTNTPLPPASATSAATATSSVTPTKSSTPKPAFAGFQVYYSQFFDYGLLITFRIPGITQAYGLDVSGKAYSCKLDSKYPDELFCLGPSFPLNTQVKLSFYNLEGDKTPLFETTYRIEGLPVPTVAVATLRASSPGECPQRGVDPRCEVEYRNTGGGCCVVATCVDACGYWFSVDTCNNAEWSGTCSGTPPIPFPPTK